MKIGLQSVHTMHTGFVVSAVQVRVLAVRLALTVEWSSDRMADLKLSVCILRVQRTGLRAAEVACALLRSRIEWADG